MHPMDCWKMAIQVVAYTSILPPFFRLGFSSSFLRRLVSANISLATLVVLLQVRTRLKTMPGRQARKDSSSSPFFVQVSVNKHEQNIKYSGHQADLRWRDEKDVFFPNTKRDWCFRHGYFQKASADGALNLVFIYPGLFPRGEDLPCYRYFLEGKNFSKLKLCLSIKHFASFIIHLPRFHVCLITQFLLTVTFNRLWARESSTET